MSVRITGPVLSALLYEHSAADNDVEGLLLGSVTDVIKDTISDSSISNIQRQTLYSVFSFIPCSLMSRWYDNHMAIKEGNLKSLIEGHGANELIGWFKLRRNSSLNVSMKERSVSRRLLKWMREDGEYGRKDILFMLCVSQFTNQTALFLCDHQFMVYNERGAFIAIPEAVTNLAETTRTSYSLPIGDVTSQTCSYTRVLGKFKSTFVNDDGESAIVGEVRNMNKTMLSKLKSLSASVGDSEEQLAKEFAEVLSLRQKVAASQGVFDQAQSTLHFYDAHCKPGKTPEINLNLTETADVSEIELMADDDNNGFKRCAEGLNSDSSNESVLLLDTNCESSNDLPCLQPVPVAVIGIGSSSAAGIDKDRAAPPDSLLNIASQKATVYDDSSGELSSTGRHRQHHSRPANNIDSKPPEKKTEPFGFVNDMLASLASPVKISNKDIVNASSASNSLPSGRVLNTSYSVDPTAMEDSDEDGV